MLSNLIITLPLVLAGIIARGMETPWGPPSASAERRTIEDAAIVSTQDPIERVDQRLDAAMVAFREDLSARVRTRLLWTPLDPTLVTDADAVVEQRCRQP